MKTFLPYALPPAEAKLPLRAVSMSFFPGQPQFCSKLAKFLGTRNCVLADKARTLLYLVFRRLKLKGRTNRGEILLPGYTCYSLPAAVVKAGLKVSLYDLDPCTFQPDWDDLRRRINPYTLGVVGQHLLGVLLNLRNMSSLTRSLGVCFIEDSAQYLVQAVQERRQDEQPDYSVFSFGRGKPLPLGQGGALIAGDEQSLHGIALEAQKLSSQSSSNFKSLAVQIFSSPWLYWTLERMPLGLGQTIYDPGFRTYAMSNACQRMGDFALQDLGSLNLHRARIVQAYSQHLAFKNGAQRASWPHVRYPVLTAEQESLTQLAAYGVRRLYPQALCDLKELHSDLAPGQKSTPGAREIARQLVTLPTHMGVGPKMAVRIAREVQRKLGRVNPVG